MDLGLQGADVAVELLAQAAQLDAVDPDAVGLDPGEHPRQRQLELE